MKRFLAATVALLASIATYAGPAQPNFVVVMTDDLSLDAFNAVFDAGLMPELETRVAQQGVTFTNTFVTNAICCPSRATFLTGQYSHNHGVRSNKTPNPFVNGIGWPGWLDDGVNPGLESQALPTWLQSTGYRTAHVGKYLNGYGNFAPPGITPDLYVPPGWDNWQGLIDPTTYKMYEYDLNDNGTVVTYGTAAADYQTDVLSSWAVQFILSQSGATEPFFLNITPLAPHIEILGGAVGTNPDPLAGFAASVRPAPRHEILVDGDLLNGEIPSLVQKPSFNEADVSDKPSCPTPLPPGGISYQTKPICVGDNLVLDPLIHVPLVESQYKNMLAAMVAVDDLIGAVLDALETINVLDNTVIIFTSDNGWFYGEHRLTGKHLPYDESSRVPLIVRAPGAVPGSIATQTVLNNDFAPTIAEIAGITPPLVVDGSSLVPILNNPGTTWFRKNFLMENWFIPSLRKFNYATTFSLRGLSQNANFLYITVHAVPDQPSLVTHYELYNLNNDPYALNSLNPPQPLIQNLRPFIQAFKGCSGSVCRTLEGL